MLLNEVAHNRNIVIIQHRGEEEVAMIAASELESLMETAYLLRSPANAERLLSALNRARSISCRQDITTGKLKSQSGGLEGG